MRNEGSDEEYARYRQRRLANRFLLGAIVLLVLTALIALHFA